MYIDLSEFPAGLGDLLTISDAAAGLLLSCILIGIIAIPLLLLSKSILFSFAIGELVLLVSVMIGWVDVYFFVFSIIVFAVYAALKGRGEVGS